MEETKTLIYDGSFNGFLTAVFIGFNEKTNLINIKKNTSKSNELFTNTQVIFTDMDKAKLVWNTIQNKNNAAIKTIYFAFLSQKKAIENLLFIYIKNIFNAYSASQIGFSITKQIKLEDLSKSVAAEKKYLEKTILFKQSKDGVYYANIAPSNDILPLISKYFRIKFKNQTWLIYDAKRNYGLYYNRYNIEFITLDNKQTNSSKSTNNKAFTTITYDKISYLNDYFNKIGLKTLVSNKIQINFLSNKIFNTSIERVAV